MPVLAHHSAGQSGPGRRKAVKRWEYQAVPRWVFALAAAGALFILLPLLGMVAKVNWGNFIPLITSDSSRAALLLSLRTAAASTGLCIVFGVPLALVLARARFTGQRILRALILLPLVVPPVVGGLALLYTFGREGLIGKSLSLAGINIAFSTTAVVMAQAFVALPFLVLSLEGTLRTAGQRYEAVAATLGARPSTVLRRITLPLVLPGLVSGAVLAFARSLGEFGATLTFAGSLQGVTRTLPLEIYLQRETDPDAAVALSFLLIAVAVVVVGLTYRTPKLPAPRGASGRGLNVDAGSSAGVPADTGPDGARP
ncbi:molybdate transport system permease protein [Arthrobacter silviterrae]|uniref:Molybdate ABC transporter permease subunit n=1 Tax=Arthrobacter silviterrae TaxID=2026658 RepID=A0ABX0DE98_9MICC|nr:ABC transporter permease [Arthrobacter silviterrae]MDQ0277154.1 molybdate transport system permease protein [Arthrobacter silviterrae]NGN83710.1 molybdate ABC transporter permease subunit [Arthrobacter silviterrae]